MYQQILNETKQEFDKIMIFLKDELARFRTGRASTALVENIKVECYGGTYSLKELAVISLPDPRTIRIEPWDKTIIPTLEKALSSGNFGSVPSSDREGIRITLPSLTEESRKETVRLVNQKLEEGKVAARKWREEAWRKIQDAVKIGQIREDDKFRAKDDLQKLIDEYNKKIEEMGRKKEEEIMTS